MCKLSEGETTALNLRRSIATFFLENKQQIWSQNNIILDNETII